MPGSLALILHAHLPFIRHPEHEEFLEEAWLFEAITETYIPLIQMMERLMADAVPFRLCMSLTPPLCAMLQDELLRERYAQHLARSIDLAEREISRHSQHPELLELAHFYHALLRETQRRYEAWNRDLVAVFRQLRDAGVLEIIASAATHGLLPLLMETPATVRAQILIGCDAYRAAFGAEPSGFWLPECAYAPGLEKMLAEANLRWFVLDAHGLMLAQPRPAAAIFAPAFTAAGPAVFARDPNSSRQVWSAEAGYPGHSAYRDFYRDVGYDLPPEYAFAHSAQKQPRFTGFKYHRITGGRGPKEFYQRAQAEEMAATHASHFLKARTQELEAAAELVLDPILTMPFDAELFGHWWFEGPLFLEQVIRQNAASGTLRLTSPTSYLATHPTQEVVAPAASSWGEGGYWSVWLHENNSWIYPPLHRAAREMHALAQAHAETADHLIDRALKQLARELLLAQSSDWAFLMKTGTAREYATSRTETHLRRFQELGNQLKAGSLDPVFLSECETCDNLFPQIQWRHYA